MEIVLLLAILLFVILTFNKQKKSTTEHQQDIKKLEDKIDELKRQLSLPKHSVLSPERPIARNEEQELAKEETFDEPEVFSPLEKEIVVQEESFNEEDVSEKSESIPLEESGKIAVFSSDDQPTEIKEEIPTYQMPPIPQSVSPAVPKKSWLENFKEKNPDIEKFIGENLINKIGILILVLGISFFVKYAIDKDWINEPARVGIGILAGTIVMVIAHRLRKNYPAFSSVFVGGAISIYYLTIGIAFHDYKLFSQTIAFVIMVVITVFSAFVSVSYNRKELAILSLIGGFAVPFMVSTGEGNYKVLLTYIAILNVGMLIIAYFKKWTVVTVLTFIFTCLLYSTWFGIELADGTLPYRGALFYATVFYLIFSLAAVINNIRNKGSFTKLEYFIMLINTFFYFGIGATIIQSWKPEYKGIFTIALAAYNLLFAIILHQKFSVKKDAIYFLLGLTLTFITLTIPFQFNGNYITLFWACEAVLLIWLSQKSRNATFKIGGIIVQFLMLGSLFIDWAQVYTYYDDQNLRPFFNKIFLTGIVAVVSLVATYFLLKKEQGSTKFYFITFNPKIYSYLVVLLAVFVGYFVGILEVSYQAVEYISNYESALAFPILYHFVFTAGTIFFLTKSGNKTNQIIARSFAAINVLLYVTIFYRLSVEEMITNFARGYNVQFAFFVHYFIVLCVAYFLYALVKLRKETALSVILNHKIALWVFAFCVVYILSNEVMIHGLMFSNDIVNQAELAKKFPVIKGHENEWNYNKELYIEDQFSLAKTQIIKIGYPVLWGLLSFVFLIIGIKKQNKQLRIIALSLLGITIIKLFFYDIKNVSETGKIIAFILLGVLILIISFVYQKIKKLVIDDSKNPENSENEKNI